MLKDKLRILDGGLASTLEQMGHIVDGDPLWSARCLHTNPNSIFKAHSNFLNAGADILITASYQASISGFSNYLGVGRTEALELIANSVSLALKARNSCSRNDILIAGSVGPYGACLADGSEYTGSYLSKLTERELMDWHQPRLEALITSGVDLLAIETIPALEEALVLLKLLKKYPTVKTWIAFSCRDGKTTNFGDHFGTAVEKCFATNPQQLVGVGINCTHPSLVPSLLESAKEAVPVSLLPRVVYPNSGEVWTSEKKWSGRATTFVDEVRCQLSAWRRLGVTVIGGCCRVTPAHIRSISEFVYSHPPI